MGIYESTKMAITQNLFRRAVRGGRRLRKSLEPTYLEKVMFFQLTRLAKQNESTEHPKPPLVLKAARNGLFLPRR